MSRGLALDIFGWVGCAVLVLSLMQAEPRRFRQLNLAASALLVLFNTVLGIWSMVGMNVALVVVNGWFLVKMTARAGSEESRPAQAGVDR